MSKNRRSQYSFLFLFIVAIAAAATFALRPIGKRISVSLPRLSMAYGERAVGFELYVQSGRVAQVPDVPIGWNITVENDPSWNTKISGSVRIAAAALDASFFRNFLIVEKNESLGNRFEIHGKIVVTRDFVKERRMDVSMRDVVLASARQ